VRELLARLQIGHAEAKHRAVDGLLDALREDEKSVLSALGRGNVAALVQLAHGDGGQGQGEGRHCSVLACRVWQLRGPTHVRRRAAAARPAGRVRQPRWEGEGYHHAAAAVHVVRRLGFGWVETRCLWTAARASSRPHVYGNGNMTA
jgi:hypothetical protein